MIKYDKPYGTIIMKDRRYLSADKIDVNYQYGPSPCLYIAPHVISLERIVSLEQTLREQKASNDAGT